MYKKGFDINNKKWLMCHKTQLNQTNSSTKMWREVDSKQALVFLLRHILPHEG